MNKIQYINSCIHDTVDAKEIEKLIYNMLGIKKDEPYNVVKLEMLALLFGSISSTLAKDLNWPYIGSIDPDEVNRAFAREVAKGKMESYKLTNEDNKLRKVFGLTQKGFDNVIKHLGISSEKLTLRKTCFHEYALALGLITLLKKGYNFSFTAEALINNTLSYGKESRKNLKQSVRTDAILNFKEKTYYIEQDMGTEKLSKLGYKIRMYNDPKKVIIFTFHKAVNCNNFSYNDIVGLRKYENEYATPTLLFQEGKIKRQEKELLDVYLSFNNKNSFDDFEKFMARNAAKYIEISRMKKLYDFTFTRFKGLYDYICDNEEEKNLCIQGAHLYCQPSIMLSDSIAFRKFGFKGFSSNLFKVVLKDTISYSRFINAHGVVFDEYVKREHGKGFIEYPEEDVGALIRIKQAYKSIMNSNDKLIVYINTQEFGNYLAQMLCEKMNSLGHNIIFILKDDLNIYEARFGELIPAGQLSHD